MQCHKALCKPFYNHKKMAKPNNIITVTQPKNYNYFPQIKQWISAYRKSWQSQKEQKIIFFAQSILYCYHAKSMNLNTELILVNYNNYNI